jgi:hypothetical protein
MPNAQQYWPSNFLADMQQTLGWLLSRQSGNASGWQANVNPIEYPVSAEPGAALIPATPPLQECGILLEMPGDTTFDSFNQTIFENIVTLPAAGLLLDPTTGPDGFPVDFSPIPQSTGSLFCPPFNLASAQISAAYAAVEDAYPSGWTRPCDNHTFYPLAGMSVYGYVYNLYSSTGQFDLQDYRIDLFVLDEHGTYYYQSSAPGMAAPSGGGCAGVAPTPSPFISSLIDQGGGVGYWGAQITNPGLVLAALYPVTVSQPSSGWYGSALPTGFLCHSNTGVGNALTDYTASIYSLTDIEYLQEADIPIIVQDPYHARVGSRVPPAAGTVTLHIIYDDPVNGPTLVYTTLANESAFNALPLSLVVPPSDPLFVPDPTASTVGALQNRSFIYDCALAILVYAGSGNFQAAAKVVQQLSALLNDPAYLPSVILENAEEGGTARWTATNGTLANVAANSMEPQEPPYGAGRVIQMTATAPNAVFTFTGPGLPDAADIQIEFEHCETSATGFTIDIGVASAAGKVTGIQVTSGTPAAAGYNSSTKTITIPIGPGNVFWRTTEVAAASLVSSLAGDTFTGIQSFNVTLSTSGMGMYLDNLSCGAPQPTGSLCFSYDVFYGVIDEAYVRAGAIAWVAYAFSAYMALTLDYSPALSLQSMLNFLFTLRSTAADSTNGMFYLGYGEYQDPGYQYLPGLIKTVSTEHQNDLYFALMRASLVLPVAAVQLRKTATITASQAASLNATAAQAAAAASTIGEKVLSVLYVAPSGGVPGHFAQGVTGSTLDPSEALDASGYYGALLAHALGRDDIALQCIEFFYQTFLLNNQTIAESKSSSAWNEAYQQLTPFSGFMPYQNSSGGYSGVPDSVWQEGSWGAILALLRLYSVSGLASYFSGLSAGTTIDTALAQLVGSQLAIWSATSDGSLVGYSLAARGLPWEFEVWPMFAAAAWCWLVCEQPGLLETISNTAALLDTMQIPQGPSQTPNELEGSASIGSVTIKSIDPSGTLKQLAAQNALVGRVVYLQQGFPSLALGDFVTLHTLQITQVGWDADGMVTITCSDVQRFIQGQQIWSRGGPLEWSPGQIAEQPVGPAAGFNAFPVSQSNPRFLQGNPIDLLLATLQNELGVGQDPTLLSSNYILNQLVPVYSEQQNYDPPPPPPGWVLFQPGEDSTLINPNLYIDVDQFLGLRDSQFSGDWMEFQIQRPIDGKQFIEEQILKPLGLYLVVSASGQLRLKSMKPQPYATPVFAFTAGNVMGIPDTERQTVVNMVTGKMDVANQQSSTASRDYNSQTTLVQQTSIGLYRQVFQQNLESTGLVSARGGYCLLRMYSDRIFRRHAFAPPAYRVQAQLVSLPVELSDFVTLTHPLLLDFDTGQRGVVNVTCEVIDRKPNYAKGTMEFLLLDTRFLNYGNVYQIASAASNVPLWNEASGAQRDRYMFISLAALSGGNPDGTPGNTIY